MLCRWAALDLLGRRVLGSERTARACVSESVRVPSSSSSLAMPKSSRRTWPSSVTSTLEASDPGARRVRVRIGYRARDLEEQEQPLLMLSSCAAQYASMGRAVDVLQREPGLAVAVTPAS